MTNDAGANTLYRYIGAFTAQLARSGVRHAVIAPGSRSTPLVLALDRHASVKTWLHLDERAAGYFALGLARQLNEPVAIVTTSGTASANLLPSIVEASLSRIPLVALTADRPPELRDIGANQTIDQTGLFGSHPRWAVELPVTDGSQALEAHARGIAARAVSTAAEPPAGPVHVNVPLREPLIGIGWQRALDEGAASAPMDVAPSPVTPFEQPAPRRPYAPVLTPKIKRPHQHARAAAARLVEAILGRRGIIVCGPESEGLPAEAIDTLARTLGWPILADPLSGVRTGRHSMVRIIDTYDALLRSPRFASQATPEVVVRFGAAPTSKVLNQFLASLGGVPQFVVDVAGGWRDPDAVASVMLRAEPHGLCDAVVEALGARRPSAFTGAANDPARVGAPYYADPGWLEFWTSANSTARAALDEMLRDTSEPFEGYAPVALASALRDVSTVVLGNSMIIRDADAFMWGQPRALRFLGTRGASGIDGVVSTAVGAAAAGLGPVAALVGDLSFLHDLNGLWALRRHHLSLLVALVNNDGGGIFHFLPQAEQAPVEFEEWFGTPHGLDFSGAIGTFGGRLVRPEPSEWLDALRSAANLPGLTVVELRTDRERNVALHREAWARVDAALRDAEAEPTPPTTAGAR
ncbi:MAG: 2-succinyl-5-enolpyruvyl-6-hydroxy-3-cyclohexene-1-carboxylic-acid synthase [Chloroflexi bacterium]|nr:2-succinyl-5-enolpyruvyl-6-hydroxy-3-cyclohexene-1-carboxylic-acid synthase [Chloroflexota bacterium]